MFVQLCIVVALVSLLAVVVAMPAVPVVASVRGKKYDVSAETVEEFNTEVEVLTGIPADQQSVLFRGKLLSPTEKLEDLGINAGEVLNVVKGKRSRPVAQSTQSGVKLSKSANRPAVTPNSMKDAGPEDIKRMQKQMQQQMEAMLDSDEILEQFSNEERLEQTRQELLKNLDKYEQAMPGFAEQSKDILHDPVKWKEAMNKVKQQFMQLRELRKQGKADLGNLTPPSDTGVDDINDEDEESTN